MSNPTSAQPGLTIAFGRIEQAVVRAANRGGEQAAAYALERVRSHAPVRKIFRGTSYRTGKSGFREPINRRAVSPDTSRVGHANSSVPLFRIRNAGGKSEYLSGDFRAVDPTTRRLRTVNDGDRPPGEQRLGELTFFARSKKGGLVNAPIRPISAENIRVAGGKALTSRGAFEVRSGRADFKAPGSNVTRVGGRLKGELHIEGPFKTAGVTWWYVVSRTKDPVTGHLYPLDQEFGNRHNRPHPFMRPGLHESRSPFRRLVREALREGLRKR